MKIRQCLLASLIIFFAYSCGNYRNSMDGSLKHHPEKRNTLIGTYLVSDSSTYANPLFMLNEEQERDRSSHIGNRLTIDSVSMTKVYATYFQNGLSQKLELDVKIKRDNIIVKSLPKVKTYIIVTGIGQSKIRMSVKEDGSLFIYKRNTGIGFLLIFPGFAASEGFGFNYPKIE